MTFYNNSQSTNPFESYAVSNLSSEKITVDTGHLDSTIQIRIVWPWGLDWLILTTVDTIWHQWMLMVLSGHLLTNVNYKTPLNVTRHVAKLIHPVILPVRLSDRSQVTQNIISFIKNCPQWGLNPQPPDHPCNALPIELGRNLLGRRFLMWALFVSCTTSHVGLGSFLEWIEHDFIQALMIHTDNQIVALLSWQINRVDDLEVVGSNPTGDNFDEIYFCSVQL